VCVCVCMRVCVRVCACVRAKDDLSAAGVALVSHHMRFDSS